MKPEHEELCETLSNEANGARAMLEPGRGKLLDLASAAIRELSADVDLANEGEALSRKHGFAWKDRAIKAKAELARVKAEPRLGLATTGQLLDELRARCEMIGTINYKPFDPERDRSDYPRSEGGTQENSPTFRAFRAI